MICATRWTRMSSPLCDAKRKPSGGGDPPGDVKASFLIRTLPRDCNPTPIPTCGMGRSSSGLLSPLMNKRQEAELEILQLDNPFDDITEEKLVSCRIYVGIWVVALLGTYFSIAEATHRQSRPRASHFAADFGRLFKAVGGGDRRAVTIVAAASTATELAQQLPGSGHVSPITAHSLGNALPNLRPGRHRGAAEFTGAVPAAQQRERHQPFGDARRTPHYWWGQVELTRGVCVGANVYLYCVLPVQISKGTAWPISDRLSS